MSIDITMNKTIEQLNFRGPILSINQRPTPHPGSSQFDIPEEQFQSSQREIFSQSILQQIKKGDIASGSNAGSASTLRKNKSKYFKDRLKYFINMFDAVEKQELEYYFQQQSSECFYFLVQILCLVFQLMLAVYIPILISFRLFNILIIIVVLKIIIINIMLFNTRFTSGKQLNSRKAALSYYIQTEIVFDAICLIALIIIFFLYEFVANNDIFLWLFIVLSQVSQITKRQQVINYFKCKFNFHSLFKLLILFFCYQLYFLNLLICFWHSFIKTDQNQFLYSYIKACEQVVRIIMMNSQFNPTNITEDILIIVFSILGFLMHSYSIAGLIIYMSKYIEREFNLDQCLLNRPLSVELKQKIINNLNYQQEDHNYMNKYLSLTIIKEVHYQERYKILENFFHQYQESTLLKLLENCDEINCVSGQKIIIEGTVGDNAMYFILQGQFTIELHKVIKTIESGDSFEEISFFTQQPRQASVISQSNGRLLRIRRENFIKALSHEDSELFAYQRDLILYSNQFPISCYFCQSKSHLIKQCPYLTYQPNKKKIIQNENMNYEQQIRQQFARRMQKQENSLQYLKFLKELDSDFYNYLYCDKWNFEYHPKSNKILENQDQFLSDIKFEEQKKGQMQDPNSIPISIDICSANDPEEGEQFSVKKKTKEKSKKLMSPQSSESLHIIDEIDDSESSENAINRYLLSQQTQPKQMKNSQSYRVGIRPSIKQLIPSSAKTITAKSSLVSVLNHLIQLKSSVSQDAQENQNFQNIEFNQRICFDIDKKKNFDKYYKNNNIDEQIKILKIESVDENENDQ